MSKENYWIGLTDASNKAWFKWSDNAYLQYTNANFYLNDHKLAKCVKIKKESNGMYWWGLKDCENKYGYICKVRKVGKFCDKNWVGYKGYCCFIQALKKLNTWENSFSICQSKGGNLLSIENHEEDLFIQNLIQDGLDYWIDSTSLLTDISITSLPTSY